MTDLGLFGIAGCPDKFLHGASGDGWQAESCRGVRKKRADRYGPLPVCSCFFRPELGDFARLSHGQSSFTKSSNMNVVSVGPLQASGWNWEENHGLVLWRTPSFDPSFMLIYSGSQSAGNVLLSTA